MTSNTEFVINLENLRTRITTACERSGRDASEVDLMAVTKTNPALAVEWALEAGLTRIGENRVQEALGKRPEVVQDGGFWELIGPLQTNKARAALEVFDRIQTLDRLKLVGVLDRLCGELGKQEFPVLLQVNVSEDPAKHGCDVSVAS